MRKLKILMIAPTPFFADRGCHMQIYEQARSIQKRGHEVRIVTYPIGRDMPEVTVVRMPNVAPWYHKLTAGASWTKIYLDFFLIATVWREARRWKPDILHGHLHEGCFIGWVVSKFTGIPFVFDLQGSLTGEMLAYGFVKKGNILYRFFFALERWLDHLPPHSMTHSTSRRLELIQVFGILPERVTTIFDGTNLDLFRPFPKSEALMKQYAIPHNKKLVVYLGRLEQYQGVDLLIQSISGIVKQCPDVHFLIFGYPNVEFYTKLAEDFGVREYITFGGRIEYPRAGEYICLGDFAVTLKQDVEDNGKLYNYMSCALPVVALDNGVNREVVGDTGFYVKEFSTRAVQQSILEALRTPEHELKEMGKRARAKIMENFTWDKSAERMEGVYAKILL